MRTSSIYFLLLICIGLVLSVGSLWQLWEQDIFWQIRAGRELLTGLGFQFVDAWSFTGAGEAWQNHQWLSTILLHIVHWTGGEEGLVLFRGILVAVYLLSLFFVLTAFLDMGTSVRAALFLLPFCYFATSFRLQLRPDFLVLILFTATLGMRARLATVKGRFLLSVVAVVIGSNLHPGSNTFLAFVLIGLTLAEAMPLRERILYAGIVGLAFFATPYQFQSLTYIVRHLLYRQHNVLDNPDFLPFSISMINPLDFGWYVISWILLLIFGILSLAYLSRRANRGWTSREVRAVWVLYVVLTCLSLARERAIPFHVSLTMLIFSRALGTYMPSLVGTQTRIFFQHLRLLTIVACLMIPIQLMGFPRPWGVAENDRVYPVGSVKFLRESGVKGPIFHTPDYGNYLLGKLPSEKVFMDTREVMYDAIQETYKRSGTDAAVAHRLLEKFGVQIVLMPIGYFVNKTLDSTADPDLRREQIAPSSEWAVLYFDPISVVLVRRSPQTQELVGRTEYRYLLPYRSASAYFKSSTRSFEKDKVYLEEVQRCLRLEPQNIHCSIGLAVWKGQDRQQLPGAITLLEGLRDDNPSNLYLLSELKELYDRAEEGKKQKLN